jgi:hemoglobin/transferrin/lactoferrin receptor protein
MPPALAQQPAAEGTRLKEVSVSATRTERDLEDVAATVTVIPGAEIERLMVRDIKDLIRYEPGVEVPTNTQGSPQFGSNPQRPGNSGFSIRGVEGNRVQILVDGIRVPDAYAIGSFSGTSRDLVDLDVLSRVEILRGPASTLYGSDALGGVVSFTTYDPGDLLKPGSTAAARLRAGYFSVDESKVFSMGGAFSGDNNNIAGLLFIGGRKGEELDNQGTVHNAGPNGDLNYLQRTAPNPADYKNKSLLGKFILKFDARFALRLTADVAHQHNDFNALNAVGQPLTGAFRNYFDVRGDDEFRRSRYSADLTYAGDSKDAIASAKFTVYTQQSKTDQTTDNLFIGTPPLAPLVNRLRHQEFTYKTDTKGAYLQFESHPAWGGLQHRLIYGAEYYRTDIEALRDGFQQALVPPGAPTSTFGTDAYPVRDFPNTRTTMASVFAQDEIQIGRLTLIPGVRYDHYKLKPTTDSIFLGDNPGADPEKLSFSAVSPKLGGLYALTEANSVYGQVSRGFRAPPANDVNLAFVNNLFPAGFGNYTSIANPDLKEETSTGLEVGLRGAYREGGYGVAAFYNRYRNFIDSLAALNCPADPGCVPGFDFTFQSINRAKVVIYGFEAKGDYKIARDWGIRGAFAWAHGDDKTANVPLNSISPAKVVAGLQWQDKKAPLGAEAVVTWVNEKHRIDTTPYVSGTAGTPFPAFASKSYTTLDLLGWWRPVKNVTVNAGVFNIFDKKYWQWGNVRLLNANAQNLDFFTSPGRNASVTVKFEI